jgi:hypothetical protein
MSDVTANESTIAVTAAAQTATARLREEFLCSTFAWALKREPVDVNDDFFTAGGDSMKATLVLVQWRERLDASFSVRTFFKLRTVAKVAAAIPEGSLGIDAEEVEYDGGDGFGQVELAADAQDAKLVASAESPALALEVRAHGSDKALAPSVIYLSAWLDLLATQGDPAVFPLSVRCSAAPTSGGFAWCVPLVQVADLPTLQRRLLSEPGPSAACGPAQSAFVYSRTPQVEHPALALGARGWGLVVRDASLARFELYVASDAVAPRDAQAVLDEYLQRIAHRLKGLAG